MENVDGTKKEGAGSEERVRHPLGDGGWLRKKMGNVSVAVARSREGGCRAEKRTGNENEERARGG